MDFEQAWKNLRLQLYKTAKFAALEIKEDQTLPIGLVADQMLKCLQIDIISIGSLPLHE